MSSTLTILVVDDDAAIRSAYCAQLADHNIAEAATFEQAMRYVEQSEFDLVLLDVWLGETNSLPLIEKIKQANEHTQIVMISGASNIRAAVQALQLGARDYLEKPVSRNRLLQTVRAVHNDRRSWRKLALDKELALETYKIVGESSAAQQLREQIAHVGPSELAVLIQGPTGSGKELVAQNIHWLSGRAGGALVNVNCAALAASTVEAELFGYRRGAFTGADRDYDGLIMAADGGTMFLDEIGDLPLALQPKLLRVIETGRYTPLGDTQERTVDVRWVSATHKDLLVSDFREDLYHRLAGIVVRSPALQERPDDIPALVDTFIRTCCAKSGITVPSITQQAMDQLCRYSFAGNIRELRQIVERTVVFAGTEISQFHYGKQADDPSEVLNNAQSATVALGPTWEEAKRQLHKNYLSARLTVHNGNKTQLAGELGIHPNNLHRLLRGVGL